MNFRAQHLAAALLAALTALALGTPSRHALAAVYTWTDEKGVVHMTDRKPPDKPGQSAPTPGVKQLDATPPAPPGGGRDKAVRDMLDKARRNTRLGEIAAIAAQYHATHTYSMLDYFVCVDMALEMANILKTRNFKPLVVAGTTKTDVSGMEPERMIRTFDHAWVVVELEPGVNVAVETTAGVVADEKIPNFERYYQGLVFENPRQAKDTDVLIRTINEDCKRVGELIEDWNRTKANRPVDQALIEHKGRIDGKVAECKEAQDKYKELIRRQFKALY